MENREPQLNELMLARRVALVCFSASALIAVMLLLNRLGLFFQFSEVVRPSRASLTGLVPTCFVLAALFTYFNRSSMLGLRLVIFGLAGLLLVHTGVKGALSLNFYPVALVLMLLAAPTAWQLRVGILSYLLFSAASFLPSAEVSWPLHLRMVATNAMLIWPLATLLGNNGTLERRKKLALERLGLSAGFSTLGIVVFDPQAIHALAGALLAFASWWWIRGVSEISQRARIALLSITFALYFFNLVTAGQLPSQALYSYLLLAFLLFSGGLALAAGSAYLLLVLYSLLHFEPDLVIALAVRAVIGGVMLLFALYFWSSARVATGKARAEALEVREQFKNFAVSLGVVGFAFLLLYLPLGESLEQAFGDEPGAFWGWLLMSLAVASLSSWLMTLYLNSQQLQQRANNKLRELNQDLKTQRQLIERQQAQQNHMFSVIGHELRTPIASLQMLFEKVAPYALGRERSAIQGNLRQTIQVLDDLKLAAQPEAALVQDIEPLRPADLVRVAAHAMEGQLNDRGVDLELFIDRDARMVCEMSAKPLRQSVAVMLKNVAMHSRATAVRVSLEAVQSNGKLILDLRVEDNGTGVLGAEAEQLFQAFYRQSTDSEGLGLGLSVARSLVEAQGGRIEYFDSHMGGAGFHVHLEPVLGKQAALVQIDLPTKGIAELRVLLVEDNDPLRTLTATVLEKAGATVTVAANGRQALDLISDGVSVDLVLTDIYMPEMDGYELAEALREIGFSRIILGVTAATVGRESQRMVEAGADACLNKPLSVASIELAYQRALKGVAGS